MIFQWLKNQQLQKEEDKQRLKLIADVQSVCLSLDHDPYKISLFLSEKIANEWEADELSNWLCCIANPETYKSVVEILTAAFGFAGLTN